MIFFVVKRSNLFVFVAAAIMLAGLVELPRVSAQSATTDKPKFEVASVKPCIPTGRGPAYQWSPGRLTVYCQSARVLMAWAYIEYADGTSHPELNPFTKAIVELTALESPVEDEPAWVQSVHFAVSAEVPGDASEAMMLGPMMESLLEDRFDLKIHWRTKEVSVYNLVVAKGGPKLPQTDTSFCRAMGPNYQRIGPDNAPNCTVQLNVSMEALAKALSGRLGTGRAVIDKTGIAGTFKIQLLYTRAPSVIPLVPQENTDAPVIFEAVKDQLGLELVPASGPQKILVIDHIEEPTPN